MTNIVEKADPGGKPGTFASRAPEKEPCSLLLPLCPPGALTPAPHPQKSLFSSVCFLSGPPFSSLREPPNVFLSLQTAV